MASKKRQVPDWMLQCKQQNGEGFKGSQASENVFGRSTKRSDLSVTCSPSINKTEAFNDHILDSMLTELTFQGKIEYANNIHECLCLCEVLQSSIDFLLESNNSDSTPGVTEDNNLPGAHAHKSLPIVMGLDLEWPVTFQKGSMDKTALLQLCLDSDTCYLFHLSSIGSFPNALKGLINHVQILKVGVAIESDLWKLERDFGLQALPIIRHSMVDLSLYANTVLKASENWSLDGLCRHVLKQRISKDPTIRTGNWAAHFLSEEQKLYAATDAYVSYKLYRELQRRERERKGGKLSE